MGLIAARRFRRFEITTLPELFERAYDTRGRILGVIGQLVIQSGSRIGFLEALVTEGPGHNPGDFSDLLDQLCQVARMYRLSDQWLPRPALCHGNR